jgi:hypothetical protein
MLFTSVVFSTSFYAGELHGSTINYMDGTKKQASIAFPLASNAKTISISDARGKKEIVDSELILSIDFQTSSGKEYHLERIYVNTYDKKHKEAYTSVNKVWGYRLRTNSKLDYFTVGSKYKIRKKEQDLEVISQGALGQVMHCFRRPDEEGATAVHSSTGGGVLVGADKYFLKSLTVYFSDNPALASRIEDGDFKKESLLAVYDAYCL